MIIELPNFVPLETVHRIRKDLVPFLKTPRNIYESYRDGATVSITETLNLKHVDEELHILFAFLQKNVVYQRYKPTFNSADSGYEFHRYPPGAICHCHTDGQFVNGFVRYASVILHLNTIEDGGELVFPNQNKHVKTEAGKIVVFPPYGMFEHYTTPAKVDRDVIVTWFVYDGINVGGV
jgi:predicted 2-oxoglutarate/Fe(II)-dependent dioxygenase YbiX